MLSVLICDSDMDTVNSIRDVATRVYSEDVRAFKICETVLFYLEDKRRDNVVVFIELDFDKKKGIRLAKSIKKINAKAIIIFMSLKEKYDCDIYEVSHTFFLPKPVDREQIKKAFEKSYQSLKQTEWEYICANTKTDINMIPIREILYMEKEKRKIHVVDLYGKVFTFYSDFKSVEEKLGNQFFRCHNSYIINLKKVEFINNKSVVLNGKCAVPVSRAHIKDLKKLFGELLLKTNQEVDMRLHNPDRHID